MLWENPVPPRGAGTADARLRARPGARSEEASVMKLRLLETLVRLLFLVMGARIDLAPSRWRMRIESVKHPSHADLLLLDQRGIYAWYADARALAAVRRAGIPVRDGGLIYIGKATSFRDRLRKHINGNSSLRKTLRGILIKSGSPAEHADVSTFMSTHFRVAMLPMAMRGHRIAAAEGKLIRKCKPALNVIFNPARERVKRVRSFARARRFGARRFARGPCVFSLKPPPSEARACPRPRKPASVPRPGSSRRRGGGSEARRGDRRRPRLSPPVRGRRPRPRPRHLPSPGSARTRNRDVVALKRGWLDAVIAGLLFMAGLRWGPMSPTRPTVRNPGPEDTEILAVRQPPNGR